MSSINELLNDKTFLEENMALAIREAKKCIETDVPIGAIIFDTKTQRVISASSNSREKDYDPLCHAEIKAIQQATTIHGDWRLNEMILFSTLEPCIMCAGALFQSRIGALVFGAQDPQYGAGGSIYNPLADQRLNHNAPIVRGILKNDCEKIINDFFQERRKKK